MPIVRFAVSDLRPDVRILAIWRALLSSFFKLSRVLSSALPH